MFVYAKSIHIVAKGEIRCPSEGVKTFKLHHF